MGLEILLEKLWERCNYPGASLISPLPGILALNISPQRITALRYTAERISLVRDSKGKMIMINDYQLSIEGEQGNSLVVRYLVVR